MSRAAALISKAFLNTSSWLQSELLDWVKLYFIFKNENKPIIKLCLFVGWWRHWWWPRKNITGFAKLDFFKISPHIVGSFKDTMTQESLLKNQGKICEICFRISFVILRRWVDISFHALIFHFYKTWNSRNEIWHQKENITQVGFRN